MYKPNVNKTPSGARTDLGNYLRLLRLERGFDNVSDYIRAYAPPISSSYYRDIENGRRLLSLDSATQVCRSLEADTHTFFYNLLCDALPVEAREFIISPSVQAVNESILSDRSFQHGSYCLNLLPRSQFSKFLNHIVACINSACDASGAPIINTKPCRLTLMVSCERNRDLVRERRVS
jgi:hypothetical protein